jgi:hypothetical protein
VISFAIITGVLLMNQQQNLDIFSRSVVGSLEGTVSYSVSTNKTDGVYLTISKNHVGKYIFCKSEDIKMFNTLIKKILSAPILKPKTVGYAK